MKKPSPGKSTAVASGGFSDSVFKAAYPLLYEHMADTTWEGGGSRETSTVVVRIEAGRFNVCLNDREAKASLYVTSDTVEEGLQALEAMLASDNADFRPWKGGSKRK